MPKEESLTVGQWCVRWFSDNRGKWNGNTEGGYRNLIYNHILPTIGNIIRPDRTSGYRFLWCPAESGPQRQKCLVHPSTPAEVHG